MGKWWCRSRSEDSKALEGRRSRVGWQELEGRQGEMRVGRGSEDWGYEGRPVGIAVSRLVFL